MSLRLLAARTVVTLLALAPLPAAAQSSAAAGSWFVPRSPRPFTLAGPVSADELPEQLISVNALLVLHSVVDAEYERRVSRFVTAGAATRFGPGESSTPCCVGDLFMRFYPNGETFNGFSVGAKAGFEGPTGARLVDVGLDVTHGVMLNPHLYLGVGARVARRLREPNDAVRFGVVPALRVNLGVGF